MNPLTNLLFAIFISKYQVEKPHSLLLFIDLCVLDVLYSPILHEYNAIVKN